MKIGKTLLRLIFCCIALSSTIISNGVAQNTDPVVSAFTNAVVGANRSTPSIPFTIGDMETPATNLTLTGISDNTFLVPNTGIVFGGSASNRTVRVTPTPNRIGFAQITVRVTDAEGASVSGSFTLTVTNTPPVLSAPINISANVLIPSFAYKVTVGDRETQADSLILTATSGNTNLLPNENILLGGSASNRTVQFFPLDELGSLPVTLTVTDSLGGSTSTNMNLTIFNTPPSLSDLPHSQIITINSQTNMIPFKVGDKETPVTNLVVTAFSTNTALLPVENILFTGSGTNRALNPHPVTNEVGTTLITLIVKDSTGDTFTNQIVLSVYQLVEVPNTGLPAFTWSHAAWGDYDNDGYLDLAFVGLDLTTVAYPNYNSRIYHNNGDGTFTDIKAGLIGVQTGAVAWGDYDNDGYLDLLLTGDAGSEYVTRIYHNNRDGTFTNINTLFPGARSTSVAWGDYNNDGKLDFIVTGYGTFTNFARIFRNTGNGLFIESGIFIEGISHGSVKWSDYDNDGNLDFLISGINRSGLQVLRVYRNIGQTNFVDIGAPLVGLKEGAATWGDYDNDGDQDILIGGTDGSYNGFAYVYRNDGSNNFVDIHADLMASRNQGLDWGDYDNDGYLDIAFGYGNGPGFPPPQPHIYKNVNGVFTDSHNALYGTSDGVTLWADYDNDGRLDVLETGYASVQAPPPITAKLYRNYGPITNSAPNPPGGLSAFPSGDSVLLSWSQASDSNQTGGLSYNLRVGTSPGGANVVNPMSDSNGTRRLPALGNASQNTQWTLQKLKPGVYYWSVQAIDHAYAGSAFATEQSFAVKPVLTVSPGAPNGQFQVQFNAIAGIDYHLLVSTNLSDWTTVTTFTRTTNGTYRYIDPQAGQYHQRFYELRIP